MGMSTHAVGFKPPDEKWKAMKAIWDACRAGKVDPPKEVWLFFDGESPSESGVQISQEALLACGAVRPFNDCARSGFEVDCKKLPPDVTVIRVYNHW